MGTLVVSNVGKAYKRYRGKWSRAFEWLSGRPRHEENWVLRDVSFRVDPGEAVGIIGVNGAGKSTLLKIITGTTSPSCGRVETHGRIAALLELGIGFHPDFTGRQNVRMGGQLMGMTAAEVEDRMHEIEAFAEIGDYIDRPLRTYSSGMQVRLAFAVATAVRPDILIVDEALAVGDIFFQQKCFERIRCYREHGTTLLFVSHSPGAIYALCNRAILLAGGRLLVDDSPRAVIDRYNAMTATVRASTGSAPEPLELDGPELDVPILAPGGEDTQPSWRHAGVRVQSISVVQSGRPVTSVISAQRAALRVVLRFDHRFEDPHVGFRIHNARGEPVFMTNTLCMKGDIGAVVAGDRVAVEFEFDLNVAPGEYTLTVGVANGGVGEHGFREQLARLLHASAITVLPDPDGILWSGSAYLKPSLNVRRGPN